jgi:transcriptional regulator with XRE-family HTH domain
MDRLRSRAFRHGYVAEHIRRGVAYQIRELRHQRGWNQGQFSKHLGKPQSVVCRLEDPGYGKYTIQTLLEIASVFDVAVQVRFVPFSKFLRQTRDVSVSSLQVESFEQEVEGMNRRAVLRPASDLRGIEDIPVIDGSSIEPSKSNFDPTKLGVLVQ